MAASHSFSVLSQLPDSTRAPSAENATEVTTSECPSKVRMRAPVAASHSFSVLSELPDSTRAPSAENATELTPPECPSKVRMSGAGGRVPQLQRLVLSCPTARGRHRPRTQPK